MHWNSSLYRFNRVNSYAKSNTDEKSRDEQMNGHKELKYEVFDL